MEEDLELHGSRYQWLITIFYMAYVVFAFQAILWKVIPPHIWASLTMVSWGIIAASQSAVSSWQAEMALRFLLGVAETGFAPGVPYLLSFFYLRHEIGLRCALFLSAAPFATTFSGALAYGITSGQQHLARWRLLFLVEGLPTILMAPVAYLFLPDSPDKARFLSDEEKRVVKARAVRQVGKVDRIGNVVWKDVMPTLLDAKCWLIAVSGFT